MAGEMNFNLLNPNAPAEAALAPIKGMAAVNALQSQQLQNDADQMAMRNALAEQEAYKQAGGDVTAAQRNLMGAGLGKQAAALGKSVAETQQAQMKAMAERLPIQRDMAKDMAFNPSDQNIQAHLQDQVIKGWITPQEAQMRWQRVAGMNPQQREQFFLNGATKAEDVLQQMETRRHNKVQEGISGGNLAVAQGHLKLAQENQASPEAQALISKAILDGRLDPNRVNSRNRSVIAATLMADPNANLRQLGEDAAGGMTGARAIGGQEANVAIAASEARKMIGITSDLSANVDRSQYPSINAISNAVAKGTGDQNIVKLNTSINALVNTYARAINPKGVATVSDKNHARDLINAAYSNGQLGSIMQVMDQEMAAAQSAGKEARAHLRGEKPVATNIPQGAIDALKSGKGTDEQFDAIFGKGAAAKVKGK